MAISIPPPRTNITLKFLDQLVLSGSTTNANVFLISCSEYNWLNGYSIQEIHLDKPENRSLCFEWCHVNVNSSNLCLAVFVCLLFCLCCLSYSLLLDCTWDEMMLMLLCPCFTLGPPTIYFHTTFIIVRWSQGRPCQVHSSSGLTDRDKKTSHTYGQFTETN